jgi:hypothetical protein
MCVPFAKYSGARPSPTPSPGRCTPTRSSSRHQKHHRRGLPLLFAAAEPIAHHSNPSPAVILVDDLLHAGTGFRCSTLCFAPIDRHPRRLGRLLVGRAATSWRCTTAPSTASRHPQLRQWFRRVERIIRSSRRHRPPQDPPRSGLLPSVNMILPNACPYLYDGCRPTPSSSSRAAHRERPRHPLDARDAVPRALRPQPHAQPPVGGGHPAALPRPGRLPVLRRQSRGVGLPRKRPANAAAHPRVRTMRRGARHALLPNRKPASLRKKRRPPL